LRFFDDFSHSCPDEVTTVGLLLTTPDGTPAVGIGVCYCGPLAQGESVLKPLRTFSSPLVDLIAPQPYVQMQSLFDDAWPAGRLYYHKGHNMCALSADAIETLVAYAQEMPTPLSSIYFQQIHGAASRVAVTETAFPHRYDYYNAGVHPATDDPADCEKMIRWARECWQELEPFAERAVYVNLLEDALEEGEHRVQEAYGPNYQGLVALKNKYDPTNFFRMNANIRPTL